MSNENIEYKIEVMTAFANGKKIQRTNTLNGKIIWENSSSPAWNWAACNYRVQPEEVKPSCNPLKASILDDLNQRKEQAKRNFKEAMDSGDWSKLSELDGISVGLMIAEEIVNKVDF